MKIKIIKSIAGMLTCAIIFVFVLLINNLSGGKNEEIEADININQPLGSDIKNVLTKDDYLYIVVTGGSLSDRIVILNTKNGKIVSNVSLN